MKFIYLGLGSNTGDRLAQLEQAINELKPLIGPEISISPLYETPALLPETADASWNKPFYNMVIKGKCALTPIELLQKIKQIEFQHGREKTTPWAPRTLDIDILYWQDTFITSKELTVPHLELSKRAFVLDPLKDLAPSLILPNANESVLTQARKHPQHSPIWMAVLNVTPDSFSDGGEFQSLEAIDLYLDSIYPEVGIIDIGAESTRPGAQTLSWQDEWMRLEPVLKHLHAKYRTKNIRPRLSADTRHYQVAERAIELGVQCINDVSGLSDVNMLNVLKHSQCDYILMHSLSVPADPKSTLSATENTIQQLMAWFKEKLRTLKEAHIADDRIMIDPGVGFGKTSLQSLHIMRELREFQIFPHRLLVGHSRKSFLKDFTQAPPAERDIESIGISVNLVHKGVDILRVHNPLLHRRAVKAAQHTEGLT